MRVAVIGSRSLSVKNLGEFLPEGVSEILSGGARGVDASAKEYAEAQGIPLREFLPEYERYGKAAPLRRNLALLAEADLVLAFWDGSSRGTAFVIRECRRRGVSLRVIREEELKAERRNQESDEKK